MAKITNMKEFKQALEGLSLDDQRVVAARFVADVFDLTGDERVKHAQEIASRLDATPEELMTAYHSAKHAAAESSLHSDWELIDWKKQAAYFVAKACAACLAPAHQGIKWRHLAWNTANHCRMARTCASIEHEQEQMSLSTAEEALNKQIQTQFAILGTFLESK